MSELRPDVSYSRTFELRGLGFRALGFRVLGLGFWIVAVWV